MIYYIIKALSETDRIMKGVDAKRKIFRQIEGALTPSQAGNTYKLQTTQEQNMNNTPPILIIKGKTYPVDIETSSGKIELPHLGQDDFLIKIIDYHTGQYIEFEHV